MTFVRVKVKLLVVALHDLHGADGCLLEECKVRCGFELLDLLYRTERSSASPDSEIVDVDVSNVALKLILFLVGLQLIVIGVFIILSVSLQLLVVQVIIIFLILGSVVLLLLFDFLVVFFITFWKDLALVFLINLASLAWVGVASSTQVV